MTYSLILARKQLPYRCNIRNWDIHDGIVLVCGIGGILLIRERLDGNCWHGDYHDEPWMFWFLEQHPFFTPPSSVLSQPPKNRQVLNHFAFFFSHWPRTARRGSV